MNTLYLCLALIGLFLVVILGWRLASRRWSLPCPPWLGWLLENPLIEEVSTKSTLERLDLAPGMSVLDVGCGPGRLTIPIARLVGPAGQVVAIDIQPEMLRRAEAKAQAAGLSNIRFRQVAAGAGQLEPEACDRAVLVTVLGEIPDREAAFRDIFHALKPGGILSVTEVILDPHYQSRRAVRGLAEAAGFREVANFGSALSFTLNLQKPATNE